jgi:hypothetical protein
MPVSAGAGQRERGHELRLEDARIAREEAQQFPVLRPQHRSFI